jgi:DNA-binding MarR family transcriptional regulator
MVAIDTMIEFGMIIHMTRTTSTEPLTTARPATTRAPTKRLEPTGAPAPATARTAAVAGVLDELNGAVRLLRCASTGRMVKQGISMTHLHVMWRLEESGELPMSRLADYLDVALSNATGLVDRMEERGLVTRSRVSDDRRVVLVRLTATGQGILEEVQIMKRDLMNTILERLDDRQLGRLHAALRDLRRAVRAEEAAHPDHFDAGHDHEHPHPQQQPASRADGRELSTR